MVRTARPQKSDQERGVGVNLERVATKGFVLDGSLKRSTHLSVTLIVLGLALAACGAVDQPGVAYSPVVVRSATTSQQELDVPADTRLAPDSASLPAGSYERSVIPVQPGETDMPAAGMTTERRIQINDEMVELAYLPVDGLGGSLVPWVVPAPGAGTVYYTTWEDEFDLSGLLPGDVGGVPVIRRFDVRAKTDTLWRMGAYAPAVTVDGKVGFVEDLNGAYNFSVPNPNRVIVANSDGPDEVWSTDTETAYVTVAWANDSLIVYTVGEGEYLQVFAFDGPDRRRLLSDGGMVGAISPDGSEILIVEVAETGSRFTLTRVSDGAKLAVFDPADAGMGPVFSSYGGDWVDDTIVLPAANGDSGETEVGLLLLTRTPASLVVDRFVGLSMGGLDYVPEWVSVTDSGGLIMRATIDSGGQDQHVEIGCNLETNSCSTVSSSADIRSSAIVRNPSRGATQ